MSRARSLTAAFSGIWVQSFEHADALRDVVNAIREQNMQVASGQIGQEPVQKGQETQITLSTLGRLDKPEQFADIIVKVDLGLPAQPSATATAAANRLVTCSTLIMKT